MQPNLSLWYFTQGAVMESGVFFQLAGILPTICFLFLMSKMEKLRPREGQRLSCGHTAKRVPGQLKSLTSGPEHSLESADPTCWQRRGLSSCRSVSGQLTTLEAPPEKSQQPSDAARPPSPPELRAWAPTLQVALAGGRGHQSPPAASSGPLPVFLPPLVTPDTEPTFFLAGAGSSRPVAASCRHGCWDPWTLSWVPGCSRDQLGTNPKPNIMGASLLCSAGRGAV